MKRSGHTASLPALLLSTALTFAALPAFSQALTECPTLEPQRRVLETAETYTLEEWTLTPTQVRMAQHRGLAPAAGSAVIGFRERIRDVLNPDFTALHERQIELVRTRYPRMSTQRQSEVLSGQTGRRLQPSCLELYLLDLQIQSEAGMHFPENEMMASMLSSPENNTLWKLIVIFANTRGSVPGVPAAKARVHQLVSENWNYMAHLHNHPIMPENSSGDVGGTLVASGTSRYGDVAVYMREVENLGLKSAYITNGFDTVLYTAEEIRTRLSQWEN